MEAQQVDILPQEFILEHVRFVKKSELGRGAYGSVSGYEQATPGGGNTLPLRLAAKCDIGVNNTISKETYFLGKMMKAGLLTVPKYYGERYNLGKSYIIMQLVEYSVDEYLTQFKNVASRLNLPQICELMLRALQSLHEINLIHLDVKPENFRISEDNKVYLFDFGLVNDYAPNGRHKPLGKFGFQGSPYFASVRALNGYTLSRRDDIESLGYTIMHLLSNDQVPWKDLQNYRDIKAAKEQFLDAKTAIPEIFIGIKQFINKARTLGYEEDPDYNAFRHDLRCMMKPMLEDKAEKAVQMLIQRHGLEIARSQLMIAKGPVVDRLAKHYSNFNKVLDSTLKSITSNFAIKVLKFAHQEREIQKEVESYCENLIGSFHNKLNPVIIQVVGNSLIEVIQQNVTSLSSQYSALELELKNLKSNITTEQNTLNELIANQEQVKTKISELETQIKSLLANIQKEEQKLSDLKSNLQENQALLGKVQQEVKVLLGQISDLTAQLATLRDQIKFETENLRDLKNQQAHMLTELDTLKTKKKAAENEVLRIEDGGRKKKQQQSEEAEAHRAVVLDLEKQKFSLNGEVTSLNGEKITLIGEKTKLNEEVTSLRQEKTKLTADIKGLEEQKSQLNSQIGEMNSTLKQLQTQVKSSSEAFAKQIQDQQRILENKQEEVSREDKLLKDRQAEQNKLEKSNLDLQNIKLNLQQNQEELNQNLSQLQEKMKSLSDDIEKKTKEYMHTKSMRDSELISLSGQILTSKQKLIETENSITSSKKTIESQQKDIKENQSKIDGKISESQGLDVSLNELRQKKEALQHEHDNQAKEMTEQLQRVKQELESENRKLKILEASKVTFETQIATEKRLFLDQQELARTEAEQNLAQLKTKFTELNNQYAERENEVKRISDKKLLDELEMGRVQKQLEDFKSQIQQLKDESQFKFDQEKIAKEGQNSFIDIMIAQKNKELTQIETNLQTQLQLQTERQANIDKQKAKLNKLQQQVQALEGQQRELLTQIEGAKDISSQKAINYNLQQQVRELESKNAAELLNQKEQASKQLAQLEKMHEDKIISLQEQSTQELNTVKEQNSSEIERLKNNIAALVLENQKLKESSQTSGDPQDSQVISQKQGNSSAQPAPLQGDQQAISIEDSVYQSSLESQQPMKQLSLSTSPLTNSQIIVEKSIPGEPHPVVQEIAQQIESMKAPHEATMLKRDFMVKETKIVEELKNEIYTRQVESAKLQDEIQKKKKELMSLKEEEILVQQMHQINAEKDKLQKEKLENDITQLTKKMEREREVLTDKTTWKLKFEETDEKLKIAKVVLLQKQEQIKQLKEKIEELLQKINNLQHSQQPQQQPSDVNGKEIIQKQILASQDLATTYNQKSQIQASIGEKLNRSRQIKISEIIQLEQLTSAHSNQSSSTPIDYTRKTYEVQNDDKSELDQDMMHKDKEIAKSSQGQHLQHNPIQPQKAVINTQSQQHQPKPQCSVSIKSNEADLKVLAAQLKFTSFDRIIITFTGQSNQELKFEANISKNTIKNQYIMKNISKGKYTTKVEMQSGKTKYVAERVQLILTIQDKDQQFASGQVINIDF
ncbi:hypothetical protein FGO68_gene11507 [Halteria grandinella]|uniref:Casein kinase I n=1 Tax=Halteria grandinella TaxID=5974 RepID=A0A8J8SXP1_HALGN|nr:hypothetical protein FGO68_gene11507 [Halteria grandinella]